MTTPISDSHRLQFKKLLAAIRGEEDIRAGLFGNRMSVSVILGLTNLLGRVLKSALSRSAK